MHHYSTRLEKGEGGVGFLVRESLASELEYIISVKYEECVDESAV